MPADTGREIQHGVYWASPITAIVKTQAELCLFSILFFFFWLFKNHALCFSDWDSVLSLLGPGLNLWAGASDPAGHAAWWTKNKQILVRTCQSWTWFYVYLAVLPFRGGRDGVYYLFNRGIYAMKYFHVGRNVGLSLHSCRRQSGNLLNSCQRSPNEVGKTMCVFM